MKNEKVGVGVLGVQSGVRLGWGRKGGSTNVNKELKVLLKEHKYILQLITVKNMKTGAHNERKLKERRKILCAPIGV